VLRLADAADPEPGEAQKLVAVRAAGINFMDLLIRQGRYPQAPELPVVLGGEIAGEVPGEDGARRVMALPRTGGYAELAAVDESWLIPLPEQASFAEGAAFLMAFLTAYLPLTRQARVEAGTVVLVHAAAGGVGSAAVQVARHLGARVIATASTDEKRELALSLGAQEAYGYEEFADRVRADVVVDPVGGAVFDASLKVLNPLGTLIAIGFAAGMWAELNPALLVGRNVGVQGFYLGRLMAHRPEVVHAAAGELVRLWEEGAIRPVVGTELPLDRAADGHRLIEERRHVGKVVLVP
jgi:NADPH2:quinone reductase